MSHPALSLLPLLVLLLTPSPTHACSCLAGLLESVPQSGVTIPRNSRIWLGGTGTFSAGYSTLVVTGTDEAVPLDEEVVRAGDEYAVWLHPQQALLANSTLTLTYEYEEVMTFSVGDTDDTAAPVGGDVVLSAVGEATAPGPVHSSCGESVLAVVDVSGATDDYHVVYELEVAQDRDFTQDTAHLFSLEPHFVVGRGACTNNYPTLARLDSLWVRSRAIDLAGNEGPWSEAEKVRLPLLCSVADSPATGFTWALLAAAGIRVTRRRRPTHM